MIIGIFVGIRGSGKTVGAVRQAYKDYRRGRKIYANFHLNFPYTHINIDDILNFQNLKNATILIDEASIAADCRNSASKQNKFTGYMLSQSRKNDVDVYFMNPDGNELDKRIRGNYDKLFSCSPLVDGPGGLRRATIPEIQGRKVDRIAIREKDRTQGWIRRYTFNPKPYFPLYNTGECVNIKEMQKMGKERED